MEKVILAMSFILLLILLVFGLFAPSSPIMWLASTSDNFALLRLGLMATLAVLLVTNPPRHLILRVVVGLASVGMAAWALYMTYANHMAFLDTMVILEVCIAAGLIILETNYKPSDDVIELAPLPEVRFLKN